MQHITRRRSWLAPAIIAAVLFVGGVAANLLGAGMDEFVARYRPWLWAVTILAGAAAVIAAIRDARQQDASSPDSVPVLRSAAAAYNQMQRDYLERIAKRFQFLPLAPVDLRTASAETGERERLGLPDVYVALDTTTQRRSASEQDRLVQGGRDERPLSALEALVEQRRLVLVGEPGGGKSTFLNYVAFCLAADLLHPRAGWGERLQPWPANWGNLLPVPITLRDVAAWFANTQPHQRKAALFFAYLGEWLTDLGMAGFYETLCSHLRDGMALLLLDGLDEVPVQDDLLQRIKEMIAALPNDLPDAPLVVTCRVLSYADPRWRLNADRWPVFELAKLRDEQIDGFIDAWYRQLAAMNVVPGAAPLSAKLKQAVRRPDLRRLAPNPLLLTVMALVHTWKRELPDARAQLYEDVVDLLLWRWEAAKTNASDGPASDLRGLLEEAGQRDMDLKQTLWQLAYDAHAQARAGDEDEAIADIGKSTLLEALRSLHPERSLDWAERVVGVMQRRAGLLVERMPDLFTFPHRTFQEYLAGCHLSTMPGFTDCVLKLTGQGPFWRVVILLAVGRLNHLNGDTERPLMLVDELCPRTPPADDADAGWRNVWLAGDCLLEVGLATAKRRHLGSELVERVQQRLTQLVDTGRLQPRERAAAGATLSSIGDPRDLDEMIPIPAGPFLMGDDDDEHARPQHTVHVANFRIGKYPVTNGQYAAFVAAMGHRPPLHWRGATPPPELRNHPVTHVTWSDAIAYCAWLSRERGEPVRLPTEAEWEKAARGPSTGSGIGSGTARIYPWGDADPSPNLANYDKSGIDGTSPVGCFPVGASPYGCLDMAGNVFEWTSSLWGKDWQKPDFGYPYDPTDGREELSAPDSVYRVLRGGSWSTNMRWVRCAARYGNHYIGAYYWGFRVVSPGF